MDRPLDAQELAQGFVPLFILFCLLLAIGAGVLEALLTLRDGRRNQSPSPELMKAAEELVAATVKFPGTTGWERGKRGGVCPGCETPGDATNTVAAIIANTPMDPSDAEYLRKLAERMDEWGRASEFYRQCKADPTSGEIGAMRDAVEWLCTLAVREQSVSASVEGKK